MNTCPKCNGKKTIDVEVHESGKPMYIVTLTCVDCKGVGEVTDKELAAIKRMAAAWCRCEEYDANAIVHLKCEDGGIDWVECSKCGKCLQTG